MLAAGRRAGQTVGAVIMTVLFANAPDGAAPRIGLAVSAALALGGAFISTPRLGR